MARKISALATAQALTGAEKLPAVQGGQTVAVSPDHIVAHAAPTALRALGLARHRRVDVVMIGDSNQLMNGYGFGGGFARALATRFGLYATPAYAGQPSYHANQNGGFVDGVSIGTGGNGGGVVSSGLPAGLEALAMPPRSAGDQSYAYLPAGSAGLGALTVLEKPGVDVKARWRCWFSTATFASGSGSFTFGARKDHPGYNSYATRAAISTNTGVEGKALDYFDLTADATRSQSIGYKFSLPGGTQVTGPFAAFWSRAENLDAEAGVSVHTLYGVGGQSLYDMAAQAITTWPMAQLTTYFAEVRRLQTARNQKPIVVLYVNSGLNDRGETSGPSLGWRQSAAPTSPAAYLDNLEALVARIDAVWVANGWPLDELFWLVMPSHPVAEPEDAALIAYRATARAWAERRQADPRLARVTMVDLTTITNPAEMLANNWYLSNGADRSHLTMAGYDAIATRLVARIA